MNLIYVHSLRSIYSSVCSTAPSRKGGFYANVDATRNFSQAFIGGTKYEKQQ